MRYMDAHCTYRETYEDGNHLYIYSGPCIVTGKKQTVKIKGNELYALRTGEPIQKALKSNNKHEREFLKTGYSEEGWNIAFGDEE